MQKIVWSGVQITTNTEYVPDYLNEIVEQLDFYGNWIQVHLFTEVESENPKNSVIMNT